MRGSFSECGAGDLSAMSHNSEVALSKAFVCRFSAISVMLHLSRSTRCCRRDYAGLTWAISTNPHSMRSEDFGTDHHC
jgi:hypothetical protein